MKTSQKEQYQLSVAYLYDPIPLDRVRLDVLKEDFVGVQYSPESELVYVESNEKKIKAQILSARLDYLDEAEGEVIDRDLSPVKALLKALPPVNVKGFGITLYVSVAVDGEKDAGTYVTRHFLSASDALEEKLGAKIIAGSQRFTYGEVTNYFDFRMMPAEIGGEVLYLHLRKHQDKSLTDSDRIYDETVTAQRETIREFSRLLELI